MTHVSRVSVAVFTVFFLSLSSVPAQAAVDATRLESSYPEPFGEFGRAVAAIGDVNSDGVDDVVVSAPEENGPNGRVYVFSGATDDTLYTLVSPNPPEFGGSGFGMDVSATGDIDGDGVGDFVVGAPGDASLQGRAYVFSGVDGDLIDVLAPDASNFFGNSVGGGGDANGDGINDIVVGAYLETPGGAAYVFDGQDGSLLEKLHSPASPTAGFGLAVAFAGDVDTNGKDEILVTSIQEGTATNAGRVYVFNGDDGSLVAILNTPNPDPEGDGKFGASLASITDVDGDGFDDVAVGAPGETAREYGRVYVFSVASDSLFLTINSPNQRASGEFGTAVVGIGDISGDGVGDIAVGAPYEHNTAGVSGYIHCLSGVTGDSLLSVIHPDSVGGDFGWSLAAPSAHSSAPAGAYLVVGDPDGANEFGRYGLAYILEGLAGDPATAVGDAAPSLLALRQNVPNPFNPSTTISYDLQRAGSVRLEILDARGQLVRTLVDGAQDEGRHEAHWNGRSAAGRPVGSGVYFYRLTVGSATEAMKMVLLK